jgi:hypothetical protein
MKRIVGTVLVFAFWVQTLVAQEGLEQGINRRIQPPLQLHDISQQLDQLERQLVEANREVDFWRNARFYNDRKKERLQQEKLIYWSQQTVTIMNEMTRLKQDRAYYQHKQFGDQRYYYKRE